MHRACEPGLPIVFALQVLRGTGRRGGRPGPLRLQGFFQSLEGLGAPGLRGSEVVSGSAQSVGLRGRVQGRPNLLRLP